VSVPAIDTIAPPALSALNQAPAAPAPAAGALTNQDFMMLLVASLKYQDPSEPMKTQELMQQTTAMTTVEQLLEVARLTQESFALQQRGSAIALVGRNVSFTAGESTRSGVVTGVDLGAGPPVLRIGTYEVSMADVTQVTDLASTEPRSTTSGSSPSAA
jgi:flagellar basal-body rod modification protein FlgD